MEAISNISVKVRKHEGLSSWMKRSNILVSFLCEQEITNFQALLITQLFTSLTVLMCSNFLNTLTLFICVIWFVCSFMLCKKYISRELSGKVSYTFEHKSYSQEKKRFENE